MKAILLPYSVDQREPSRPLTQLVDLPTDDTRERNKMLRQLFHDNVVNDCPLTAIKVYARRSPADFGDIIVEGPHDTFMYVTYVQDPPRGPASFFVPECGGWTKESVYAQLTSQHKGLKFKPDQIPDEVMQEWVDAEQDLKDRFVSEEEYGTAVADLNWTLISKSTRTLLEN